MSSRGRALAALPAAEEFGFFALAGAALRRWRLIIGVPLAAAVLTLGVSFLLPRTYTAQVVVAPEAAPAVTLPTDLIEASAALGASLGPSPTQEPAYYAQLLRSRAVLDEVLRERYPDPRQAEPTATADLLDILPLKGTPHQRLAEGRHFLEEATAVQYDPATGFVTLRVATRHPDLSAAIANRFAEAVDRVDLELRRRNANQRRLFIEERILAAEAELVEAEEVLRRFLEANRNYAKSPTLQIAYGRLRREVRIKEEALATVHREHEQARIQDMDDLPVLTVVERAEAPTEPSSPATGLHLILALSGGFMVALPVTLFQEMRRRAGGILRDGHAAVHVGSPPAAGRWTRSSAFWAGVLLAVPVFLQVGSGGIALAPSYGGGGAALTVVPASALTIPGLLLLLLLAGRGTRLRFFQEDLLVGLYVVLLTASALLGLMMNQSPAIPGAAQLTVVRFGQALFPLAAYFLARLVVRPGPDGRASLEQLSAFVSGLSLAILLALLGYILQTGLGRASAFRFSVLADHIGPFYNYKMKRFFPSYVAIASIACLAYYLYATGRRSRRLAALGAFMGAAVALMLMWSRTAMLMWLMGTGVLLAFAPFVRQEPVKRRVVAILLILTLGTTSGVLLLYQLEAQSPRLVTTALVLLSGSDEVGRGDVTRFERMREGTRVGLGRPLGEMHRIHVAGAQGRDILESENGYLELAVRAGPVAMLAVLAVFLLATARGLRLAWHARLDTFSSAPAFLTHRWAAFAFSSILLSVVLAGNVWLNLATEPYFAPLVWFLVGTAPALRFRVGSATGGTIPSLRLQGR